jgi:hypothetical protein
MIDGDVKQTAYRRVQRRAFERLLRTDIIVVPTACGDARTLYVLPRHVRWPAARGWRWRAASGGRGDKTAQNVTGASSALFSLCAFIAPQHLAVGSGIFSIICLPRLRSTMRYLTPYQRHHRQLPLWRRFDAFAKTKEKVSESEKAIMASIVSKISIMVKKKWRKR